MSKKEPEAHAEAVSEPLESVGIPHDLQALLRASQEDLEGWSSDIELSDPVLIERERQMLMSLDSLAKEDASVEHRTEDRVEDEVGSSQKTPWIVLLRNWFWVPLLAGVGLFLMLPRSIPPEALHRKGRCGPAERYTVELKLGQWQGTKRKTKALQSGQRVPKNARVVFGFNMKQSPGFVYLFLQSADKTRLIYPQPSGQKAKQRKKGFAILASGGQPLAFQLESKSAVTFIAVKTAQTLPPKELALLKKNTQLVKKLKALQCQSKPLQLSFDTFSLRLGKANER